MAVKKILLLGNPALRARCAPVKSCSHWRVRKTITDLRETLEYFRARNGFGRGIAAPQIGSRLKIIYVRTGNLGALINPRIVRRSARMFEMWDDCFSFPDILVKVQRYAWVAVAYADEEGKTKVIHAAGALSELLQHETDHVNGILAIDRAIDKKHIVLRSEIRR